MNDLFVNYEQALALKELGFNEHCFGVYGYLPPEQSSERLTTACPPDRLWYLHEIRDSERNRLMGFGDVIKIGEYVPASTFQQAFRWFREKHNLFGCIDLSNSTSSCWWMRIDDIITNDYVYHCLDDKLSYPTYEAAEQSCLTKLIEIVQNKKV